MRSSEGTGLREAVAERLQAEPSVAGDLRLDEADGLLRAAGTCLFALAIESQPGGATVARASAEPKVTCPWET